MTAETTFIKKVEKWQASDGTVFDTKEEAIEHELFIANPQYKALKERLDKLEQDILGLQLQITTLRSRENFKPFTQPFGEPLVRYTPYNSKD